MHTIQLMDVMNHLPHTLPSTHRLFVDLNGHIQIDHLPSFMRPLLQLCTGRFSRDALILRLYELSTGMVRFEMSASSCMTPHILSYQKTGVMFSSVDVYMFHIGIVLQNKESLLRIIDHVSTMYSLDLVLMQTSVCQTTQRLSDLHLIYSR
jgi:hypothetical protein